MAMKKILIGGGTGFIGRNLRAAFEGENCRVMVISREDRPNNNYITWDRIKKIGLPEGTTHVINAAGANVLDFSRRWTDEYKNQVIISRVETNRILAEAIDKAEKKPSAFLTLSGVGIYKPDPEILYDENSEVEPFDFFSKLVIDWENAAKTQSGIRHIALRTGVVLGRDGGMIKQIYPAYLLGLGGPMGSGKQYFPWIQIEDLVSAVVYIMLRLDYVEGPVNAVTPQIITNEKFCKAFAASINRHPRLRTPEFAIKLMFGSERASMILEGPKVNPTRLWTDLKYRYLYPDIESACAGVMKEYNR